MENFEIAIIVVLVLVVLYLLFGKSNHVASAPIDPVNVAFNAIIKATASCAAVKDEATYNAFTADYLAANTAIAAVPTPPPELVAAIVDFNNLSCNRYSSYINMINLFDAAFTKALDSTATEDDYERCAKILAVILYLQADYESSKSSVPYMSQMLQAANDKFNQATGRKMPPPGLVKHVFDNVLKLADDDYKFSKDKSDRAFYENYKARFNSVKQRLDRWKSIGPIGPSGEKLLGTTLL